jgi:RNA polymerase sigma factor (sigma-70 family)
MEWAMQVTPMLDQYFHEVSKFPLLTRAEEVVLFERLEAINHRLVAAEKEVETSKPDELEQANSKLACVIKERDRQRNQIANHNLRLVVQIAKKYKHRDMAFDDLIQYGNIALLRAVDLYKLKIGTKFSTYACIAIHRYIQRVFPSDRLVSIPVHAWAMHTKTMKHIAKSTEVDGRSLSISEAAVELGFKPKQIKLIVDTARAIYVLLCNGHVHDGNERHQNDLLELTDPHVDGVRVPDEDTGFMVRLLDRLIPYEREVLMARVGATWNSQTSTLAEVPPKTLGQIGEARGVTKEAIRQVQARAITKLRSHLQAKGLI